MNKYFDRDLSWLTFNYRVLQEALDPSVPLYEKLKFLGIFSSNLDEFFRVRVASLRRLSEINKKKINKKLDLEPDQLLHQIMATVRPQLEEYGNILREIIFRQLRNKKIFIYFDEPLKREHRLYASQYFKNQVLCFLQPVFFKNKPSAKTFLENKALYFILRLRAKNQEEAHFAYLNIPSDRLDRFIKMPNIGSSHYFLVLDDLIRENLEIIFPFYEVLECYSIKLNRDDDLNLDDEFAGDLVDKIRKQIKKRNLGNPARFLYDQKMPEDMLQFLISEFELQQDDLVPGGRYHNLYDLIKLHNPFKPSLENEPMPPIYKTRLNYLESIFELLEGGDQMLHFPYHSYDYVLRFFSEAAIDPLVKEINATFYRVASDSLIVNALISAARNGKKVNVFMEIKARFDEENNLYWAERMEKAGIKIIYSMPGLKVHAKVAMVKRNMPDQKGSRYYSFLGTGNFNEATARIYADHGLLTSNQEIGKEIQKVFSFLYKKKPVKKLKHLLVSQVNLQQEFIRLIDQEIRHVEAGKKGHMIIKVNNLEDPVMIDKLYEASQAGVRIELIVRSICCLVPGVTGQSENITVKRLVDRYLEHARIFYFRNHNRPLIYLGSADWMKRNLYRRVEVCFPLFDTSIRQEIRKVLELQLKDNQKVTIIDHELKDKSVKRVKGGRKYQAQTSFYKWLSEKETNPEIK